MSPYFASYLPALHPLIRSKHPLQFCQPSRTQIRTRWRAPKAPAAAVGPATTLRPFRSRPPAQGRPSRVTARRPATPAAPPAAAGDSGVPPWRHSLFVWPRYAARGGGRPGYRRAHVAPMALRTRSADAPLAPPPPLAG